MAPKRTVWFLEVDLLGPLAHHWAIRVGNYDWYEIGSGKESDKRGNSININGGNPGRARRYRNHPDTGKEPDTVVGSTTRSDGEIHDFNVAWLRENGRYNLIETNCQKYVTEMAEFLVGPSYTLKQPESYVGTYAGGPSAHATASKGYAGAGATVGKAKANFGPTALEAEGPNASARASFRGGQDGITAMATASVGKAEAYTKAASITLEPNVNTGIAASAKGVEANLLGFGFNVGQGKGLGINTPIGSIKLLPGFF